MDIITDSINWIIKECGDMLSWAVNILPDSPFSDPASPPNSIDLGYVTWLIPFPTMILHLALLLVAIGTYYTVRVLLRWIKLARE